jgi:N-acetylneuraminic acid mutarotase
MHPSAFRICCSVLTLLMTGVAADAIAASPGVSSAQRIAWQRAIERARWEARIWPADNPGPKPSFEQSMPDTLLRARVAESERSSFALEHVWSRPITPEALQAEIDRMTRDTRDPAALRRLFNALHEDPFAIAEGLARPILSERLARRFYARDAALHAATRQAALTELARLRPAGLAGADRELIETDDAFEATIGDTPVRWPKTPFETWLSTLPIPSPKDDAPLPQRYRIPDFAADTGCAADTWTLEPSIPSNRDRHTAVWTGTEMIVFGGQNGESAPTWVAFFDDGYRYDPAIDTWTPIRRQGAPSPRYGHTAVWTGSRMIVWGGTWSGPETTNFLNDGASYDPAIDTWSPLSAVGAPPGNTRHTAVWTGSKMLIWGGFSAGAGSSAGGAYTPATGTWSTIATANAPTARYGHLALWTGSRMIIWGGSDNTGGRYDPSTNTWSATSTISAPDGRDLSSVVWTGTTMIVWGGHTNSEFNTRTGGRYDPATDSWQPTSLVNAPSARRNHVAVWSGSRMIVWGGNAFGGGRYDPVADAWTGMSLTNIPTFRNNATAVWSGSEMIVWGGSGGGTTNPTNAGGRYNPVSDSWLPTFAGSGPSARNTATAVWTGAEAIVWGGGPFSTSAGAVNTGSRYDPALDTWTPTATVGAPTGRIQHTAVWSGARMIVWGGRSAGGANESTGGRYDPASNTWSATATSDAPSARIQHSAVWTGSKMVIWGGWSGSFVPFGDGGRYDPVSDSWAPTSFGPGVRYGHVSAWTGSEMIVFGGIGSNNTYLADGGRYNPVSDVWSSMAPFVAGLGIDSVWTGTRMIVGAGAGGIYDPESNAWTPTSGTGSAPGRGAATAWDGSRMLAWGGRTFTAPTAAAPNSTTDGGGLYDPATDTWSSTSREGAPSVRDSMASAWMGTRLLVFGGRTATLSGSSTNSGGIYCTGCAASFTHFRDRDGDGHGDPADFTVTCVDQPVAGYAGLGNDCNDASGAVWTAPGETGALNAGPSKTALSWGAPTDPGGTGLLYDVLRSPLATNFTAATCVSGVDSTNRAVDDATPVNPGEAVFYLVRAKNACGAGTIGAGSDGSPRSGAACP